MRIRHYHKRLVTQCKQLKREAEAALAKAQELETLTVVNESDIAIGNAGTSSAD